MKSQIIIEDVGSEREPHRAAILDLSQGRQGLGLLLPKVSLIKLESFEPLGSISEAQTAEGMLIYNTNETLGRGTYFWNGEKWYPLVDVLISITQYK